MSLALYTPPLELLKEDYCRFGSTVKTGRRMSKDVKKLQQESAMGGDSVGSESVADTWWFVNSGIRTARNFE